MRNIGRGLFDYEGATVMNCRDTQKANPLGTSAILLHLGLVVFLTAALISGLLAGDYKKADHLGFIVHSWIGMAGAYVVVLRMALGFVGPPELRFSRWVPYTRQRLSYVKEDIAGLLKLELPERQTHVGMAGLVQSLGLFVLLLAALSGIFLFFTIEPGYKARGIVHAVKEFHEVGLTLISVFLSLHIGAVTLHALRGRHLWRKMFFLKERQSDT